jgi:16S rRNA (cytosine967-C5)-methyltransferase
MRAPIGLRVNLARLTRGEAAERLRAEGIETEPNPLSPSALTVTEGARQVQRSAAFAEGLVELQDASSQAVVDFLPLAPGQTVLDFCAGGGGKSLALAMHLGGPVVAHDSDAARMADIPARAARAGADIRLCASRSDLTGPFDLVLADAPCSGSGSWRRAPEAKWRFTEARLAELTAVQDAVLEAASEHVGPGGCLAYATCSVLREENDDRVAAFLGRGGGWQVEAQHTWPISPDGDGFFCTLLRRE